MSMTQTVAGSAILVAAMQMVWTAAAPPVAPIVVHSIAYEDGFITQDRTVSATAKFTAVWNAEIVDAETGAVVPNCSGGGSWDYEAGHRAIKMTLQEWVGNPDCKIPDVGTFYPRATYKAGEFYLSQRGDFFSGTGDE